MVGLTTRVLDAAGHFAGKQLNDNVNRERQQPTFLTTTLEKNVAASASQLVRPERVWRKHLTREHNCLDVELDEFGKKFFEKSLCKKKNDSPLLEDFTKKVNAATRIDRATRDRLVVDATKALNESIKPGYEKLTAFLAEQTKRATEDAGVWKFKDGPQYYASALHRTTTTNMNAKEIHKIGLRKWHASIRKWKKSKTRSASKVISRLSSSSCARINSFAC